MSTMLDHLLQRVPVFDGATGTKIVRTLSPAALTRAADDLVAMVERSGFIPDAVVGIETGGLKVVESLATPPPIVLRCRMARPSTELKKSQLGRRLLRSLPYALADRFRLIEDWIGSRGKSSVPSPPDELVRCIDEIARIVAERGLTRLLVVDDAVDSGGTLGCVMSALRARLPEEVRVVSAVITRTRPPERTATEPDFALHSMVLCRFPWSFDYKVLAA
ncbi:phosphoribosyltransferase family protein [Streptomyces mirabilis]|uniref:phosphoribosyltransferase family protein n=1 Tax=Streptomyces mirabilis TaxID=68239 RepID=UPI0036844A90